jgi:uroporphyrinogen-III synthase
MNKIGVLSTKKLSQSQKQFLLNANFVLQEQDFIQTEIIDFKINHLNTDFLIFTSQNSVKSVAKSAYLKELIDKPVYCVGSKTAIALKKLGFSVIKQVNTAIQLIPHLNIEKSYLFFCGDKKLEVLPQFFMDNKIENELVECYQTNLNAEKIENKFDALLFYSPSGVTSYLQKNIITNEMCFCIGNTTAKALKNITKNIIIANRPTVENVIIQCIKYYNK